MERTKTSRTEASPAAAQELHLHMRYKWEVMAVVMIGTFMATLDQNIVNISLHDIMADFGSTIDDIAWVITGYMLAFASLMSLTAWFRDHIGYKNTFIIALGVFTLGSLLCGVSWNLSSLITFRVIQALGGGAIAPTGMAMITEVFPPQERGKAIGIWGVGIILGPTFGPTIGGFLTHTVGWRSIFLVNLPVGILGVIMAVNLLRKDEVHPEHKRPFDFAGFFFLTLFLVCFLLALSLGEEKGWSSAFIITNFILAVFGLAGFLLVENLVPNGIIDLQLFKIPVFAVCAVVATMRSIALFGPMFLLPLFLQNLMGFDEIQSGLILVPGALVVGMVMPLSGRLGDKIGPRLPTLAGLVGVIVFMYMYRLLDVNTTVWGVIYPTLIRGAGMGLLMAPVTSAAVNSLPRRSVGMGSAVMNVIMQVSGAIGIAFLGTLLDHRTHFHQVALGGQVDALAGTHAQVVADVAVQARMMGLNHLQSHFAGLGALAGQLSKAGAVQGFDDAFLAGAFIVALAFIPSFLLPNKPVGHGEAMSTAE